MGETFPFGQKFPTFWTKVSSISDWYESNLFLVETFRKKKSFQVFTQKFHLSATDYERIFYLTIFRTF